MHAHWTVYGSVSGRGPYEFLVNPLNVDFGHEVDVSFSTQFGEFWQFFRFDLNWYCLARTSWLPGGQRGEDFVAWCLLLPAAWVESEDCRVSALPAIFPAARKPLRGEAFEPVALPQSGRRYNIGDEPLCLEVSRRKNAGEKAITLEGVTSLDCRLEVLCKIVDGIASPKLRREWTFATRLLQGRVFDCVLVG